MVRWFGCLLIVALVAAPARAIEPPAWLPRYDLDIRIDPAKRIATVKQLITFTNRHQRPAHELVFNAHGRYEIPDNQVGFMAKMAELLRMSPKEGLYFDGPPLDVTSVHVVKAGGAIQPVELAKRCYKCKFEYGDKNPCSFVVPLLAPVGPGESVTVELDFVFRIPNKKGRWSQWEDITTLAQWLPTLAVYNESGWHALPFIPWHQPFYNEAGVYTARVTLPADQKLAAPMAIQSQKTAAPSPPGTPGGEGRGEGGPHPARDLRPAGQTPEAAAGTTPPSPPTPLPRSTEGEGRPVDRSDWVQYELEPAVLRDFSLTCSPRYVATECMAGRVKVRCLHFPEHAFYGKVFAETVCQALPIYEKWFGPYPYSQFTIAEASFGWNGNECSGMVLIDDRMFNMPHLAKNYPVYLIQHELCHQWFYNVIGTNGYSETFVDEGLATYFSHKLADLTLGKNNKILEFPTGLGWMPNIHRDDLRLSGIVASRARGELHPTVQPIDKFGHLAALMAYTYDRGGKIFGQIEARLGGDEAMIDFMRIVYRKYAFQILHVADLQRELELYTGRSWDDFFQHWVHGPGACDWKVDRVSIDDRHGPFNRLRKQGPAVVTVDLLELEGFPEPTVLGIQLTHEKDRFDIRIPIDPSIPVAEFPDFGARVESRVVECANGRKKYAVQVVFNSPCTPKQIVVDPDHVLLDCRMENNAWTQCVRIRPTALYTMLDEVDVTNSYDRWSVIFGPWIGTPTTVDPWYTRSPLAGFKVGGVRIQEMTAGAFVGYRTNDSNVVAGAEGLWSHVILPEVFVGFNVEYALTSIDNSPNASRAAVFARYVVTSASSLYTQPFEYVEAFAASQNHPFPYTQTPQPNTNPFYQRNSVGVHYHKYYLTPYWDPEGGVAIDASYQCGVPIFGQHEEYQLLQGQFSTVKSFPEALANLWSNPVTQYLRETRFAFRFYGGAATAQNGLLFSLGGGDQFRGFDIAQRQGSLTWLGSIEWRVPILQNCKYDCVDHLLGVRNVYLAPFYDVGQIYVNGEGIGDVAHAVGLGLRVDVQWVGIIERTMLRFDVAKTVNASTPVQVWLGIQHPF